MSARFLLAGRTRSKSTWGWSQKGMPDFRIEVRQMERPRPPQMRHARSTEKPNL
jgi:hypothetical protein